MSEFNAALGLLQLKYIDQAILQRKAVDETYRQALDSVDGIHCLVRSAALHPNYAYFPILVDDNYPLSRDELYDHLKLQGVYPRRYFYPLISEFPMYQGLSSANSGLLPVSSRAAAQILCLPIYPDLPMDKVEEISGIIGRL
jgi:dTDP-4-amino-4,6-dideoxygalactose transaminase